MSFLEFTGKVNKEENNYVFKMQNIEDLIAQQIFYIPSPIVDNNFKAVFAHQIEIAKSLAGSLLFPCENLIDHVEYLPSDLPRIIAQYPEEARLYGYDSLRADVLLKVILKQANVKYKEKDKNLADDEYYENDLRDFIFKNNNKKNEGDNNLSKVIIDLEMQIGYNIENIQRFIDYAKSLNLKHKEKVILLILNYRGSNNPKKNKGFEISLGKTNFSDFKKISIYDDYVIYQIDLDYCLSQITNEEGNFWIIYEDQKMDISSKEWIKFLTLPIWCKSSKNYYYDFPPLKPDFFKTKSVYDAFVILSGQNESNYISYAKIQEDQNKKIEALVKLYKDNKEKDEKIKEKDKLIEEQRKQIEDMKKKIDEENLLKFEQGYYNYNKAKNKGKKSKSKSKDKNTQKNNQKNGKKTYKYPK